MSNAYGGRNRESSKDAQEHLALLRQPDAACAAHDEARADLILEAFDVKADRRLGEVHLARRLGEAAGVADGDEGS
jgi:hypothetical protein